MTSTSRPSTALASSTVDAIIPSGPSLGVAQLYVKSCDMQASFVGRGPTKDNIHVLLLKLITSCLKASASKPHALLLYQNTCKLMVK